MPKRLYPYCSCGRRECRPGRPLCRRKDSKRNRTCKCGGYHFDHREGSKLCLANPRAADHLNEIAWGPEPELASAS